MPETRTPLQRLQESFRRAIKADAENGTLLKINEEPTTFYPDDCKLRMNESFCKKIFDLLLSSEPSGGPGVREQQIERYCKKICPGLRVIFIILFSFTRPEDLRTMLDIFRQNVLENNLDISDRSLPLEKAYAKDVFGESAGKAFFNYQPKLLPSTLQGGEFRQMLPTSGILPWFDEADSVLGEGAYGTVHKVKIARGYFVFKEPRSRNADPVLLARKDFRSDGYADFQAEDFILQKLMSSTSCPSSIMQPICSVVYTPQTEGLPSSSIFFLPAKQNLWDYMTQEAKPTSDAGRLQNIKRMLGICQGLDWLHRNLEYQLTVDEPQFTAYYHCDLKPDNILVCEDPSTRSLVFRISDFGQARGLRQKSSDGRYRRAGSRIPLPDGRGEYTYLPPECQTREDQSSANSTTDVWSFACILMLMIIFNHGGGDAVKEFQSERLLNSLTDEKNDRFYIDNKKPRLNPAVISSLRNFEQMPTETYINGDIDLKFTQSTLKYLEKSALAVDHERRHKIGEVLKTLRNNFNDRPPAHTRSTQHSGVPVNATYCSNLPDERIIFSSKTLLRVYKPGQADPEGSGVNLVAAHEGWSDAPHLRPSLKSCTKSEVCTVFSSRALSQPTIGHVQKLETSEYYRILLSVGYIKVDSVALSQKYELIAICSSDPRHQGLPARVSLYKLGDLKSAASQESDDLVPVTETDLSQSDILMNRHHGDSGVIVDSERTVDLCFSADGETLYCVYKIQGREDQAKACLWNTHDGIKITERIIHDDSPESRKGFFLANIVPFTTFRGFIYITNEDSIGVQRLHGDKLHEDFKKVPGCAGLKTILLSSDDQRLVMISRKTDGLHVYGSWLSQLQVHKPDELKISRKTREMIWYKPDHDEHRDNAYLRDNDGKLELHLTIWKNRTTHTIGLDRLFVSDLDGLES